jgi:nuclear transport factor 2 (NTF2) superfamily protein
MTARQADITAAEFDAWLRAYQRAWEGRDPAAAALLFTEDSEYYWTPLDPPQRGRAGVAAAWEGAVSQQRGIRFTFDILAINGNKGIAAWRADFTRLPAATTVRIEGVLTADFAEPGQCRLFREWWHSAETA